MIERERLRTLYSVNARPQKEVWCRKRITKIVGFSNKIKSKFGLNCMMYKYYVSRDKEATITHTDVDFPSINPNDILTIVAYLRECQTNHSSIRAYSVAINFLKDFVVEFCRPDIEFAQLFGTENVLVKITYELPEAQILAEGPIE